MKLSVVVVSWRSRILLHRCLLSLTTHAPEAEVVVVDNASGDGTASMVSTRFPDVVLLASDTNLGFAGGCNRGVVRSAGDAVLLLNPDTVVQEGAIQSLVNTMRARHECGAVGGALMGLDGEPQRRYAPRPFPTLWSLMSWVAIPGVRAGEPVVGTGPVEVEQVAGTGLLLRREALEKIGGLDMGFWPVWFEDVDLCLRLHHAGYSILHHPGARFVHAGGSSVRRMDARSHYCAWYRNLQRYTRKHHGAAAALLVRALTIPGAGLRLAGTLLPGGAGHYGRAQRAAAYLQVASRSVIGWPNISQSMF